VFLDSNTKLDVFSRHLLQVVCLALVFCLYYVLWTPHMVEQVCFGKHLGFAAGQISMDPLSWEMVLGFVLSPESSKIYYVSLTIGHVYTRVDVLQVQRWCSSHYPAWVRTLTCRVVVVSRYYSTPRITSGRESKEGQEEGESSCSG
jgi:hypothetical protein